MPTVVIADDSPTLRRIVTSVLTKEGYDVVAAEDGVEAVQAVFGTMPDACVFDVQMPRVSGYVAARVVKDDWMTADIPVVLLTSLDSASDRYWGSQAGADRYLSKDFEAAELAAALAALLRERAERTAGAPDLRPDPVALTADDVLQRVCDILDRKLFETSVQAEIIGLAGQNLTFEKTIQELLRQTRRFVDYDLCALVLPDGRQAYVDVAHETSLAHYERFLDAATANLAQATGEVLGADELEVRLADPEGLLDEDDDDGAPMATFLSMPLRGRGGRVTALLALSSATKNAFGEAALSTLQLVDTPAAVVLESVRPGVACAT